MELVAHAQRALIDGLLLSLPLLGAAWLAGIAAAKLQEVSGAADPGVSQLPRVLAVAGALALAAPWMARVLGAMILRAIGG